MQKKKQNYIVSVHGKFHFSPISSRELLHCIFVADIFYVWYLNRKSYNCLFGWRIEMVEAEKKRCRLCEETNGACPKCDGRGKNP